MTYEEWKETYYDELVDAFSKLDYIDHFESFCHRAWYERQLNSEEMNCDY